MSQEMTEHAVTTDAWLEVADGEDTVVVSTRSSVPFFVRVGASIPGAVDAPRVWGDRYNPVTFSGLDPDTKVFVRAATADMKVVVTK